MKVICQLRIAPRPSGAERELRLAALCRRAEEQAAAKAAAELAAREAAARRDEMARQGEIAAARRAAAALDLARKRQINYRAMRVR